MEVVHAKPDVRATAGDGVAMLGDGVRADARKENRAVVPVTQKLAEILIAGLAVGDGGTETKRQGEQPTPTMPSDKAHAVLRNKIIVPCYLVLPCRTGGAQRMPSQDLLLRQPLPKAVTFICLQVGIWQRCQISRLFHEDAQGAQVIHLSILPR